MKKILMAVAGLCLIGGVILFGLGLKAFMEVPAEPTLTDQDRQAIRTVGESFIRHQFSPTAAGAAGDDTVAPFAQALKALIAFRAQERSADGQLVFVDGKAQALDQSQATAQLIFDYQVGDQAARRCTYFLVLQRKADGWQVVKALADDGLPSPGEAGASLAAYDMAAYEKDVQTITGAKEAGQ